MRDLKCCPFCGGEVFLVYHSGDNAFRVFHKSAFDEISCSIVEPIKIADLEDMSLNGARNAWNRRADDGKTAD